MSLEELPSAIWVARKVLFPGNCGAQGMMTLTQTVRLCRYGKKSWEVLPHVLMALLHGLHLLFCGWACVEKKKASPVCLPLPLLRLLVWMVGKSGASQVTYQTFIGVRCPELVTHSAEGWNFGRFVTNDKPLRGGFLPVFWDVPRADGHAVADIGAVVEWLSDLQTFQADAKSIGQAIGSLSPKMPLCPVVSLLVPV